MGHVAISVDHLTQHYSLGLQARHDILRDRVAAAMSCWNQSRSEDAGKGRECSALTAVSFEWPLSGGEV